MEAKIVVSRMRLINYLVQPLALPHLIPSLLFPVMGPLLSELPQSLFQLAFVSFRICQLCGNFLFVVIIGYSYLSVNKGCKIPF